MSLRFCLYNLHPGLENTHGVLLNRYLIHFHLS